MKKTKKGTIKYPKLRELREALKAIYRGPCTVSFPRTPHTPYPGFRGKPAPDENQCIACGACAKVCPARAIEVKDDLSKKPPVRTVIWHYDLCIFCGQCERLCTTEKGVKLSPEYDLATADRSTLASGVEKELVVCECCGEIIAPREQLLWLIKKLGPLASGNFNLVYTQQKEIRIAEETPPGAASPEMKRPDLYRILCPKCRRLVLVFNQTGKQP